jgi:HD-GYP domain-containing protein (c-di-GMP phosphodiesterase class II)
MQRRLPKSAVVFLAGLAVVPAVVLALYGHTMVMPPLWVHFYGVGVSALVAAAAAATLVTIGARRHDARTVVVAGGFTIMATLLAVHGLVTPGVLVGNNGVIALTGAATLPVGAAVLALSSLRWLSSPRSIPLVIGLQAAIAVVIVAVSTIGVLVPRLVPAVPNARSNAAWTLLAVGLVLFSAIAIRAANTFLLTRRSADLAVVVGLVLLSASLYGALALSFMDLGWWIGHVFELVGIGLVGGSVAYDLRRGSQSRPLVGDLRASEIVAAEEAFLGARVRALMVRLAEKDASTEEHTRRVAALAVEVGERLGLSSARLRSLAIGGLLHDVGKLSVPSAILRKPGPLDDDEFAAVKQHPERGRELLTELGGFDETVKRLVLDHHERLDGTGYPRGLKSDDLDLETRILAVCDVYDALVSARVYRAAWSPERAGALLRQEASTAFDPRCVHALLEVVAERRAPEQLAS